MAFKKLNQRAITGQKGVNLVENIVLKMGFAWHPANATLDAGVDGIIEIRDNDSQRATNCILQVQSKALTGRLTAETPTSFQYLCDQRDIDYWLGGNVPVILIVSRPESGEAYWISVRHAFPTPEACSTRRIVFQKNTQQFDEGCRSQLIALAVPKDSGLYFPPPRTSESLYTNLLRVKRFADTLYVAATEFRRAEQIWARARDHDWHLSGEWFLPERGQLLSFHNLRTEPWRQICDPGSVEEFATEEWAESAEPERRRDFVRLANQCLRAKLIRLGVRFHSKEECFYFLPSLNPKNLERIYEYRSVVRDTSRKVVTKYLRKDGSTKYYRHNAFRGQFEAFNDKYYLQITPTYIYTTDGRSPYRYADDLLKGIKRLERNHAVVGQVVMWAAFLTQPPTLYADEYPFLSFGSLELAELDAGIADHEWLQLEDDNEKQGIEAGLSAEGLFQ